MRVAGLCVAFFGTVVAAEHSAVQAAEHKQHAGSSIPASASTGDEHKAAAAPSRNSAAAGQQAGRSEHRQGTSQPQRDAVSEAQKAAGVAKQLAASRIARIEEDARKLEIDLRSGQQANVARSMMSDASRELNEKRLEAEAAFKTNLHAAKTQMASGATVKAALKAAHAADKKLMKLQHELFRTAWASFRAQRHAAMARTRNMWSEARKAARQARQASDDVSRAMRKAGVHEAIYEREQHNTENIGERLLDQAENAAERGEGLIENQFGRVEHTLEHLQDTYRDEVEHDHAVRARLLHEAAREAAHEAARKARAAAVRAPQAAPQTATQAAPAKSARKAEAAPSAAAQAALTNSAHKAEVQGAGGPKGMTHSSAERSQVAFLAPVMDFTEGFTMPAVGSALLAVASAVALAGIVISRRRAVQTGERPLLG